MRALEVVLLLALLGGLLLELRRQDARAGLPRLTGIVVSLVLALHLLFEGARWQLWPAYAVALWIVFASFRRRTGGRRVLVVASGAVLLGTACFLAWALPVPRLPEASGPYAIGRMSHHLRDEARAELFTVDPEDRRELMVTVWYPAAGEPRSSTGSAWNSDVGSIAADLMGLLDEARDRGLLILPTWLPLRGGLFSYLRHWEVPASPNAQPAPGGPRPLLLFSHGVMAFRSQNTALVQELVSHGYVVAAVQHTHMSLGTVFPDGRVVPVTRSFISLRSLEEHAALTDEWLDVWARDASFVLTELLALGVHDVDPTRIGIFGHSFGGATAALACARDSRLRAGANLEGTLWGRVTHARIEQPFLILMGEEGELGRIDQLPPPRVLDLLHTTPEAFSLWAAARKRDQTRFAAAARSEFHRFVVRGAIHADFTDAPFASPLGRWLGLRSAIAPQRMHALVSDYVRTFFDRHLKEDANAQIEDLAARYPEVVGGPDL